jgi:ankyrin repeat protein
MKIVRLLVKMGGDALAQDVFGSTLLHAAAGAGRMETVRMLVGELRANVHAQNEKGHTPLHSASYMGHKETVRVLLEMVGDVFVHGTVGEMPLRVAAGMGHTETHGNSLWRARSKGVQQVRVPGHVDVTDSEGDGGGNQAVPEASGVFGTLRKVWQRRSINDQVKGRLFEAFVSSVLLYNAEVWPLRKEELQRLNRTYTGLMRQLARLGVRLRGKVDISHKAARDALGLPALESLLTQKRLRWVGHALRQAEGDASKAAVLYELQHNKAGASAKLVWANMTIMGWRNIEALQVAVSNRARFREKTDTRAMSAP